MQFSPRRIAIVLVLGLGFAAATARAQVFTVGEKTATAGIDTEFKPTHVDLPDTRLTERGRRELIRYLESEQGFAHRVLPLGSILTLQANGNLTPRDDQYRDMIYKKGQAAGPGDRVVVTSLAFKGDRLQIDLNGGPYPPHRFMRHIQIGIGPVETRDQTLDPGTTGCRILLVFEGGIPEISGPEVKALLEPVVDFSVKTGELAYADTLPAPLKSAIASHEVMVGMNRRMVLAALGQPESKLREGMGDARYEEWIYGHQPQTMRFVRFVGDRVSLVKTAAMGKPIEIRDQDEMGGYLPPAPTVALGDADSAKEKLGAPTLKLPDEAATPTADPATSTSMRKVQMPAEHKRPGTDSTTDPATAPLPSSPPDAKPSLSPPGDR
jgi:hypothetical protein